MSNENLLNILQRDVNTDIEISQNYDENLDTIENIMNNVTAEKQTLAKKLIQEKTTQMKQIQFNAYFAQMNNYNVNIMKILVVSSLLMMINIFLYTRKYISDNIYTIITVIIISITIIIITTMIYSEFRRSNYDFTTFKWTDPS